MALLILLTDACNSIDLCGIIALTIILSISTSTIGLLEKYEKHQTWSGLFILMFVWGGRLLGTCVGMTYVKAQMHYT